MNKTLTAISIAAVVTLAACQSPAKIESEPVRAGLKTNVSKARIAENTGRIDVRAYKVDGDKKSELAGVKCLVESDEVKATIVTPATLIVPSFVQNKSFENRGVPSPLIATCTYGNETQSGSLSASSKEVTTATGAGLAGALITTAISVAVATSAPWSYGGTLVVNFE